ncbi:MAG TPA: carboxymuconolactone decarboxylase family protein [Novosphingobium sp.]|nr:carboxymuconolactone decarboxylase family protein [Novosphingobium sp.]
MTDHSFSPEIPERAARGEEVMRELLNAQMVANTPLKAAARDFVFSEIWTRPGLDKRSRFWISLTCACATGAPVPITAYMHIARNTGMATIAELREFALQFAAYQGFPKATVVEAAIDALEAGELAKLAGQD